MLTLWKEFVNSRLRGLRALAGNVAAVACLLVFGLVFLWSPPAFAAETALGRLSDEVFTILTPIFVAAIGALAVWALALLKKKLGIGVSDATAASWANLARKAALRGAEYARAKAKGLTDGKKVPGPEVLEVSANWAIDVAKSAGLPEMARKSLEGLIESELFKLRLENTPAVADPYVTSSTDKPKV